jgi:ABC-type multidrug transport system ATPase subunit
MRITSVSKKLGGKNVLRDISLSLSPGTMHGLIGPNGSGKTTLFRIILGLTPADSGYTEVLGSRNPDEYRRHIGISLGYSGFEPGLSGLDNLRIAALAGGYREADFGNLVRAFGMEQDIRKKFKNYSSGMKRKISLISALMGNRQVLLLDEPTNELDIESILTLKGILADRRSRGACILFSSHILSDMERICDSISILRKGVLAHTAPVPELLAAHSSLENFYIHCFAHDAAH